MALENDFPPVSGDGNRGRFALRREPDGIYLVDGRVIPVRDDSAKGGVTIDYSKPIVGIHGSEDSRINFSGSQLGVNVKKCGIR